ADPRSTAPQDNTDKGGIHDTPCTSASQPRCTPFCNGAFMTTSTTLIDPAALTPSQWSVRLAAYLSRARGDDDPEVVAARQALASWRCRRVIDAEAGQILAGRHERLHRHTDTAPSRPAQAADTAEIIAIERTTHPWISTNSASAAGRT